jgi:hypothetical protein
MGGISSRNGSCKGWQQKGLAAVQGVAAAQGLAAVGKEWLQQQMVSAQGLAQQEMYIVPSINRMYYHILYHILQACPYS